MDPATHVLPLNWQRLKRTLWLPHVDSLQRNDVTVIPPPKAIRIAKVVWRYANSSVEVPYSHLSERLLECRPLFRACPLTVYVALQPSILGNGFLLLARASTYVYVYMCRH